MKASVLFSVTTVGLETILVPFRVWSALRTTLKVLALNTAVVMRLTLLSNTWESNELGPILVYVRSPVVGSTVNGGPRPVVGLGTGSPPLRAMT